MSGHVSNTSTTAKASAQLVDRSDFNIDEQPTGSGAVGSTSGRFAHFKAQWVEREIDTQLAAMAQHAASSGQNIGAPLVSLLSGADKRAIRERVIQSIDIQKQASTVQDQGSPLVARETSDEDLIRAAVSAELSLKLTEVRSRPPISAPLPQDHSQLAITPDWQAEGRIVVDRLSEMVRVDGPEQAWGSAAVYFRELVKGKARDEELAAICEGLGNPMHHRVSYQGMRAGAPGGFMMVAGFTVAAGAGVGLAAALGAASLGVIPIVALAAVTLVGAGVAIAGLVRYARNRHQRSSLRQLESAARGDEHALNTLARKKAYQGLSGSELKKKIQHDALRASPRYAVERLQQRLQQRMLRADPYNMSLNPISIALLPHLHPLDLQRIAKLDAQQGQAALVQALGLNLGQA